MTPAALKLAEDFPNELKGGDIYVSPQRHHWPVYDADANEYVDSKDYLVPGDKFYRKEDHDGTPETRESMLDLSREQAWALAPVRIFMDLKQERGKKTMAGVFHNRLCHLEST